MCLTFIKFVWVKFSIKYLFALMVSVYLLSNIGFPVYYHYCGGELESVNALFKSDNCCGEEEEEDSDCCQNETKIISQKSETSFNSSQFKITPGTIDLDLFTYSAGVKLNPVFLSSFNSLSFKFHPPETGRSVLNSKSVLII